MPWTATCATCRGGPAQAAPARPRASGRPRPPAPSRAGAPRSCCLGSSPYCPYFGPLGPTRCTILHTGIARTQNAPRWSPLFEGGWWPFPLGEKVPEGRMRRPFLRRSGIPLTNSAGRVAPAWSRVCPNAPTASAAVNHGLHPLQGKRVTSKLERAHPRFKAAELAV